MSDINNCVFSGRLTEDAKQKTISTGTNLVTFSVAVNTGWGEHKKVLFVEVNLWGKSGAGIMPYLNKGKTVSVIGALELQKWTSNQDGQEKSKVCLNCRECILLADGQKNNAGSSTNVEEEPYATYTF